MMDVVERATLGGHVTQVNLLGLYLHLEEVHKQRQRSQHPIIRVRITQLVANDSQTENANRIVPLL